MSGVLSLSGSKLRLGLIGNPENRRVVEFQKAVEALGRERPPCVSYEVLLGNPGALQSFEVDALRIDSPGENDTVARKLIELGGGPSEAELEYGEFNFTAEYHRGFCRVLERIEQQNIPCLNAPSDIRTMFDKWESHQRFLANDVPRPPAELAPRGLDEFFGLMRARRSGQAFLKPLHGSSASGVCAYRWSNGRKQLIAPLRIEARRGQPILVNSLQVRSYTSAADVQLILRLLLPHGMIIEQWIPKLTLENGAVDLRVLVIAGKARHWVIRQSRSPMTNLHLGNQRGDVRALIRRIGKEKLRDAFALAEKGARCFPESFYAGVDVLFDANRRAWVGEINAFGDLLPRLTHRGETAYTAIARAFYDQSCLV